MDGSCEDAPDKRRIQIAFPDVASTSAAVASSRVPPVLRDGVSPGCHGFAVTQLDDLHQQLTHIVPSFSPELALAVKRAENVVPMVAGVPKRRKTKSAIAGRTAATASRSATTSAPTSTSSGRPLWRPFEVADTGSRTAQQALRAFQCFCGSAFARNEELTRHLRIHSGQRPFECGQCGRRFGRKDHRDKHLKTHLRNEYKRVYRCPVAHCPGRYTRTDALNRHMLAAHGLRRPRKRLSVSCETATAAAGADAARLSATSATTSGTLLQDIRDQEVPVSQHVPSEMKNAALVTSCRFASPGALMSSLCTLPLQLTAVSRLQAEHASKQQQLIIQDLKALQQQQQQKQQLHEVSTLPLDQADGPSQFESLQALNYDTTRSRLAQLISAERQNDHHHHHHPRLWPHWL